MRHPITRRQPVEHRALAATPGIDVFFLGPTDLSIALGVPGATFEDPVLGAALDVPAPLRRSAAGAVFFRPVLFASTAHLDAATL